MGTESHGRLAKTSSGPHTAGPEDKPVLKLRDPKYKTPMEFSLYHVPCYDQCIEC